VENVNVTAWERRFIRTLRRLSPADQDALLELAELWVKASPAEAKP